LESFRRAVNAPLLPFFASPFLADTFNRESQEIVDMVELRPMPLLPISMG
jgi:hypothetical protein